MKNIPYLIITLLAFCFTTCWVTAATEEEEIVEQVIEFIEAVRDDLSAGKVDTLTSMMNLGREDSAMFWPLYRSYEEELFALGDYRLYLMATYSSAIESRTLTDEAAASLSENWFNLQSEWLSLVKNYHDKIAIVISPLAASQFVQLEYRYALVTDVLIASEVPMITK